MIVKGYWVCLDDCESLYTIFVPSTNKYKAIKFAESCGDVIVYIKHGKKKIEKDKDDYDCIIERMVEINNFY